MPELENSDKALLWLSTLSQTEKTIVDGSSELTLAGIMKQTAPPTIDIKSPATERANMMRSRVNKAQRLVMGETLGEGGMGIVRSARQADLGRNVAVKMLRKELSSEKETLAMLREAWVTGTLEHPNIIPIYYVDTNENNEPRIILKRIEGEPWSSLIGDAGEVKRRFGASDLLEWNLGVLGKVIDAIRYSHSRGVLHRDLKPDNVMVGEFGEVYVVDWGIALALKDDNETLLPLASHVRQMAGTPAYMAPEMLGEELDHRTDVYLLGAMLYQILSDCPPHLGQELEHIVDSIRRSSPVFPNTAPRGLCEVSRKAMSALKEHRYQNAEAMGRAIKKFIEHRSSTRLSRRALHLLGQLHEKAAEAAPEEIHELWTECRFGFQSALEAWPGNLEARQGLSRATELVAEVELLRGDPKVAESILRDLDNPSIDLAKRVESALEEARQADARMARIGLQLDKQIGQRTRVYILSLLGLVWIGMELWGQLSGNIDRLATHRAMTIGSAVSLGALLLLIYSARTTLMKTLINRQFAAALFVLLCSQIVLSAVANNIGLTPKHAQVLWIMLWAVIASMVALTVERRTWPLAVGTTLSFLIAGLWIDYRIYAMMGATSIMVINGAVIWWPRETK